jgi:hypothetical protein
LLPSPVDCPTAFDGTNTILFAYNFIFLPQFINFYPRHGTYQTDFEFHRVDGTVEHISFESVCTGKFPYTRIMFGQRPEFVATIRTKQIQDDHSVAYKNGHISRIVRYILSEGSQKEVSREVLSLDCLTDETANNFRHRPKTNPFPSGKDASLVHTHSITDIIGLEMRLIALESRPACYCSNENTDCEICKAYPCVCDAAPIFVPVTNITLTSPSTVMEGDTLQFTGIVNPPHGAVMNKQAYFG